MPSPPPHRGVRPSEPVRGLVTFLLFLSALAYLLPTVYLTIAEAVEIAQAAPTEWPPVVAAGVVVTLLIPAWGWALLSVARHLKDLEGVRLWAAGIALWAGVAALAMVMADGVALPWGRDAPGGLAATWMATADPVVFLPGLLLTTLLAGWAVLSLTALFALATAVFVGTPDFGVVLAALTGTEASDAAGIGYAVAAVLLSPEVWGRIVARLRQGEPEVTPDSIAAPHR